MDALLREVLTSADGIAEYRDAEVATETITIGSAPDRTIQFLGNAVGSEHAELSLARDGVRISCRRGCKINVGGDAVSAANLSIGDSFSIGGNCVTLLDAPAGFDVALQIEFEQDVDASTFEGAFRTDLREGWFAPRPVAWTLSLAVVALGFAIPWLLASYTSNDAAVRNYLPDDAFWTSGPLHSAHELAAGEDCRACHVEFFQRVQDAACLDCHTTIQDHVAADVTSTDVNAEPVPRCATCHREHNEPDPHLVISADALCTDCHADPDSAELAADIAPVSGFSLADHPAFAADLLQPSARRAGTGLVFEWLNASVPIAEAVELSNLKFPHETHLDPELVNDQRTGAALGCVDCHRLSLDREHFVPITMENTCVGCHELTFDPQAPDRQLPHGQPLEVMMTLEGQYLRKYSDPGVPQEAVVRRRIPDREDDSRECTDTAFNCAAQAAAADIREQFTVRGCISCHVVEEHNVADTYARYQVHPVRLAQDFFAAGRFDHYSHQVMKDATGDAACLQCHTADTSQASTDLLIPDIDNCLDCHSGAPAANRVQLGCVDCHSYHPYASGYTGTIETESL